MLKNMEKYPSYVIAGNPDEAVKEARDFLTRAYGLSAPSADIALRRYTLLSVEDARELISFASLMPLSGGTRGIIIATDRLYHEAQNALLKLLEEPPAGTVIVLCVPHTAMLLSTVRSRVIPLSSPSSPPKNESEEIEKFLHGAPKEREAIVNTLTRGKDEPARRSGRDRAIRLIDGIERALYRIWSTEKNHARYTELIRALSDIETLRGYLYDRAAPVRMILEHLSLILPRL